MPCRLAFAAFLCASCTSGQSASPDDRAVRGEVERAMQGYEAASRLVHPDSIASWFAAGGILFEPGIQPIVGPDSIRAFVAMFQGARVDSAAVWPDTIEVHGRTALYWGSYFERLEFPGQPVSEQHGKFVAEWVRQDDGRWLIARLYRVPLPGTRETR
ncbi:MAG: nuclear transport factor 2 family protein [Cytophagaceae bacterium]|nr:nuclear transport factor 2 family protein [Gemmatimonadaceae bacterium]